MPEHDGLMRIFWPLDIPRSDTSGIVVGWKNSGLDIMVVAVLEDVDVRYGERIGKDEALIWSRYAMLRMH